MTSEKDTVRILVIVCAAIAMAALALLLVTLSATAHPTNGMERTPRTVPVATFFTPSDAGPTLRDQELGPC